MLTLTWHNLYVTVNGAMICYDDDGNGEIPIVFVHGFPFDKSTWEPQMNFFKKNFRVISYDIRGFGKSSAGKEEQSIDLFADDLIQFMDQLGIQKVIACGLSMGGYILLNACHRYPEKFEAMILCDTQCIADSPEVKEKRNLSISQVMSGKLIEFADQFILKIFKPDSTNNDRELIDRVKSIMLSTAPETVAGGLSALKRREAMCATLHLINIPVLIICGVDDTLTPPNQSEYLHKHIAHSELYLIEQAGHLSNLQQPELFNHRIFQFISDLKSRIS